MHDRKPFDTTTLFVGGAGLFLQYHDIVKPTYLYMVLKMIAFNQVYGLPMDIIKQLSAPSLIEWYLKRRFMNPLQCIDYQQKASKEQLGSIVNKILSNDNSIYRLSPILNIGGMIDVYRRQHMSFPIFVYTPTEENYIKEDLKNSFPGVSMKYIFGDLSKAISKCDHNFTYIFSDIELLKEAAEILMGTYSHLLLSRDYRYNYKDHYQTTKYDLYEMGLTHPFLRIGLTQSVQPNRLLSEVTQMIGIGGRTSATNRRTKTNPRS